MSFFGRAARFLPFQRDHLAARDSQRKTSAGTEQARPLACARRMDYIGFGLIIFEGTRVKQPLARAMISRRSVIVLALGLIAASVMHLPAYAQQARSEKLDFDTVMAKDGGYAGIVKEFLGTSDPKIIAFVKREGDRYIASLPTDQKKRGVEKLDAELSSLLSKANGQRTAGSTVEFFVTNAPQLLIEFIPYERDYANIAELGRYVQTKRQAEEATRRGEEATRRGEEATRRANESAEALRRLRAINGKPQ